MFKIFLELKYLLSFIIILIFFGSCHDKYNVNKTHLEVPTSNIQDGEKLAAMYCQSCHMLPDPSLLNSSVWEKGILPNMAPRLGIFKYKDRYYPTLKNDRDLDPGYYPATAVMNDEQWQHIIDYYTSVSPDTLPGQPSKKKIINSLPLFTPDTSYPALYFNSATSYLKINPPGINATLIVSDAIKKSTYFLDKNLKLTDSILTNGPIVDLDFTDNKLVACNIGILFPNNGKHGKAQILNNVNGKIFIDSATLFDTLRRPVQITAADLNKDGKMDYIVCEFGFLNGSLSWMENKGNHKFEKHILRNVPGAIKAYVQDYNHDGLPDIWVLFAQGEEGIFLFTNKGQGNFSQEEVLRFPPVYGSSYFELDDFNKDGFPDILYTCGDNADYSPILKPFHGVYIFMNDKTNHFKQQYFYPINGCYKAIARDYDGDGDLDIATISFFADYAHHPEEGFVYLKNEGNMNFTPYSLPATQSGRWLTMDVGDVNGDGKPDIVLGNFSIGPAFNRAGIDWKKSPPFLILMNTGKL